jgi:hypothetical protein
MPVTAGSIWVEDQYLHFCPTTTTEYRYIGSYIANRPSGLVGSIWIDGENLRYLDSNKDERTLPLGTASTPTGVSSAINGSVWIENNRLNSIEGTVKQKREYHTDQSFSDHLDHTDCVHSDNAHLDNYTNHSDFSTIPGLHVDQYSDTGPHFDFNDCSLGHGDDAFFSHTDLPEFVGNV